MLAANCEFTVTYANVFKGKPIDFMSDIFVYYLK